MDSPLAIGATRVYRKYTQYYDEAAVKLMKSGDDMFDFPGLVLSESRDSSKRINSARSPKIIIAGAGMMNGGRILYHALRYLSDPQSTLLIIGYQAHGTLGRQIQEGALSVMVMGEKVAVRCEVKTIGAFSAHGDQNKLLDWMGSGKNLPKKVCLNHGENGSREIFMKKIQEKLGIDTLIAEKSLIIEI
ncbi:MAG: hypothetical protein NT034_01385 [Candidatus Magasanikbacteria bacterium]|nr:hypothetical protein [Candidatus Magasanikbacteria bacterium]